MSLYKWRPLKGLIDTQGQINWSQIGPYTLCGVDVYGGMKYTDRQDGDSRWSRPAYGSFVLNALPATRLARRLFPARAWVYP